MGVNLRYDVYVIGEKGELYRIAESILPGYARDINMDYSRSGKWDIEIKLADNKGYDWQLMLDDEILRMGLSYHQAKMFIKELKYDREGYYIDEEEDIFEIQDGSQYNGMIISIGRSRIENRILFEKIVTATLSEILRRAREKRASLGGINKNNYRDYMNNLWRENRGWRILEHYMEGYDGLNNGEEKRIVEEIWVACRIEILERLTVLCNI